MKTIDVEITQGAYPIYVGSGILSRFAEILKQFSDVRQIAIISTKNIFDLYGESLLSGFANKEQLNVLLIPDGEKAKSVQQVEALYTKLLQKRFERGSVIVALGGGVVGDIAGFVAATYLRGVDFVQVPTTLLAQVDSSIGGKTGVNHELGKNLIGAFKQPLFVYADIDVLQTLPDAELRCGLGEIVKCGFILDRNLFDYLNENMAFALVKDPQILQYLVEQSAIIKADVVARDEKERSLRMVLNYGHTFGHALEAELSYEKIKHGEAVLLGIKCALHYVKLSKSIEDDEYQAGMNLLNQVPVSMDKKQLNSERLLEHMKHDKKVKDKQIRLVLSERIGSFRIEEAADAELIKKTWQLFLEESA